MALTRCKDCNHGHICHNEDEDTPTLRKQIEKVRKLHKPVQGFGGPVCDCCRYQGSASFVPYPCPTIQAIGG